MSNWQCPDCKKIFDRWESHFCGEMPEWLKQISEVPLGEQIILNRLKEIKGEK